MKLHRRKAIGAFYTDDRLAAAVTRWAVRSASDRLCDPGFGGGAFLASAATELARRGGSPATQVHGVEVDARTWASMARDIANGGSGLKRANLLLASFFDLTPDDWGPFDAVVGNPPYIRYQRFSGRNRAAAHLKSQQWGVPLSQVASAWAPFLIHAVQFVKRGGRLGMVVPKELLHASYARPVLAHLVEAFTDVRLYVFSKTPLFPDLSLDALVLLADGRGGGPARVRLRVVDNLGAFESALTSRSDEQQGTVLSVDDLVNGRTRFGEYVISAEARRLFHELESRTAVQRLGTFFGVDIGYVTGNNSFFHLSRTKAWLEDIPRTWLRPVLTRGKHVQGLRFTKWDWRALERRGESAYLLMPPRDSRFLPRAVARYLASSEGGEAKDRYKCGRREPWWRVPVGEAPDGFLVYTLSRGPFLSINTAQVNASNSLHVLRRKKSSPRLEVLAGPWLSSLSRLSVELEGYCLGGGLLKLDPTRAERTLLVASQSAGAVECTGATDRLLRIGKPEEARSVADRFVLSDCLELSARQRSVLEEALAQVSAFNRLGGASAAGIGDAEHLLVAT